MGESTNACATLRFDRRIRLEFRGATITSDAGLLACRELDDALGLTETASECLQESRGGRNVQHRLVGLLRQSVYSRLAGYEDTNDAERLADDPTMRVVVGDRGIDRPAASTNTMSRFETKVLTQDGNVEGLGRLNAKWVDGAMSRTPHRRVILDMDSSESPVHGEQEGASYNGHFGSTCYHPLFVFNQFGDCEGAMLRAGNVLARTVMYWIRSCLARQESVLSGRCRIAKPDIYEYLEERRVFYAIRLPSNKVPIRDRSTADTTCGEAAEASSDPIRRLLVSCRELGPRSACGGQGGVASGRAVPSLHRHEHDGWPRRSGAFLQWSWDSRAVDQGGQVRPELDSAVVPSVRGQPGASVSILAYNLGNFLRRLCLPKAVKHWSLRSVQVKLIKMGGRLVRHARRLIFQLSEVSVPRRLFEGVLDRIGRLSPTPS